MPAVKEKKHQELMQFTEEMGLLSEEAGYARMSGRMMGWLLVSDPPHQSFGELVTVLQASKGSISSTTRLLVQAGIIERISFPGDRQTYFRIRNDAWQEVLRVEVARTQRFHQFSKRGLELLSDAPEEVKDRILKMNSFYAFISKKMPALLEEYNQQQSA